MPILRVSAGTAAAVGAKSMAMRSSRGISKAANTHRRTYHVSTPSSLSFRIHSAFQQQQNHRRIDTVPKAVASTEHNNNNNPLLLQQQQHHSIQTIHKRWHGGPHVDHAHADAVHISFIDKDGNSVKAHVDAYVGESLLQVAQRNDIELEGACEGVCACSTCHVVIPDWDTFENLEEASEDEEDMLDMAFGLTETSRLGCQIMVTNEMDGIKIEVPPMTRNFYVDGHVPVPH